MKFNEMNLFKFFNKLDSTDRTLVKATIIWILVYSVLILMIAFPPESYLEALLHGY